MSVLPPGQAKKVQIETDWYSTYTHTNLVHWIDVSYV